MNINFYQNLISKSDNEIEIAWKVVNDSEFNLNDVNGVSQFKTHSFEDIAPHSQVEVSFIFKLPSIEDIKEDFGQEASIPDSFLINPSSLSFKIDGDEYSISSNSLEVNP